MFLDLPNGTRVSIETNTTELIITFLQPDVNYTAFVVAYGGDLPSDHSSAIILYNCKVNNVIIKFYVIVIIILLSIQIIVYSYCQI